VVYLYHFPSARPLRPLQAEHLEVPIFFFVDGFAILVYLKELFHGKDLQEMMVSVGLGLAQQLRGKEPGELLPV
jgi:hypothetical protein